MATHNTGRTGPSTGRYPDDGRHNTHQKEERSGDCVLVLVDPGTLRGRPPAFGEVPWAGEDIGEAGAHSLSRGNWNFLPLGHRAPELLSVSGQPYRDIPIDTFIKAVVVSHNDRRLGFHSIETWGKLLDYYTRPLPRGA